MSFVEETFGLGVLMSLVDVTFLHLCLGNTLPGKGAYKRNSGMGWGGSILGRVLEKIPGSGSGSAVQVG